MKKQNLFLLLIFMGLMLSQCDNSDNAPEVCAVQENVDSSPQIFKVLFIGNSHTYTYDIPTTIKQMAAAVGDSIFTDQETPGGFSFRQHSLHAETLSKIQSQKWDYVVLQGNGWMQALPPVMIDTASIPYAESLRNAIKTNSTSTKIILYMTHGYREGVLTVDATDWCAQDPLVCDYEGMQERIRENYLHLAELVNAEIAPSGMMWKLILDKYPDIDLYQADGVHASENGSYIAACAIYSMISKRKPQNSFRPSGVSEVDALDIQQTVSDAIFECNPDWRKYVIQ